MKKFAPYLLLALSPLAVHAQPATPAPAAAPTSAPTGTPPAPADAARLIALQGALNARTFAGLQGKHAAIPADSFVRTADLGRLTQADRDALAAHGVALDVDLRTDEEAGKSPDALASDPRFKYVRISLLGGNASIDPAHMPASLAELYVRALADHQAQFRQVFDAIAAQRQGVVLYHCTAGKDRTGMVSAMLLELAGVPRQSIVHDYAISSAYLKPMMASAQMQEAIKSNPGVAALMGTPPAAIEAFLDALDKQYGGARGYLRKIGVSDADTQALLARLGQH